MLRMVLVARSCTSLGTAVMWLLFCQAALGQRSHLHTRLSAGSMHRGYAIACDTKLNVPKIALMFLARGGMPLSKVWEAWLQPIAGLMPMQVVSSRFCSPGAATPAHILAGCDPAQGQNARLRQLLFSFYVHSSCLEFRGFSKDDVFFGTLIRNLTHARRGDTVGAVRQLLKAALAEPRNERFVLLSDTDIPLYPAKLTWLQLAMEFTSRLDACSEYNFVSMERYTCTMALEGGIQPWHWRQSSLFMALQRPHAQFLADEEQVRASFSRHCSGIDRDPISGRYRGCEVDEHYYSTAMAVHGKQWETDCKGVLSSGNFLGTRDAKPKEHVGRELNSGYMKVARAHKWWHGAANCSSPATFAAAANGFISVNTIRASHQDQLCTQASQTQPMQRMESWCHLFGRRFREDSVEHLLRIFVQEPTDEITWL